jgi:branched-chain amino acid transport system substrate-binding protein
LERAVTATKSLKHDVLADYLRKNEISTLVGPIRWGADGEWANPRVVLIQFRGIKDGDLEQFRQEGKQVIIEPEQFRTGEFIPFQEARRR